MLVTPQIRAAAAAIRGDDRLTVGRPLRLLMAAPQDWAPYYGVDDAAKVYLRDPIVALDQLVGVVDFPAIQSFIMSRRRLRSRGAKALCAGRRAHRRSPLIMWRADDDMSVGEEQQRAGAERLGAHDPAVDDHRPHPDHRVRRSRRRHPTALGGSVADVHATRHAQSRKIGHGHRFFCESFRYDKSVDNGGLAQMERLLQFGRVLSRSM